jgi:hypothetical protein
MTDPVKHPSHYTSHPSGVECIEITKHHNFCIGNAIKYLWRQGLKDGNPPIQELDKAIQYIEFEKKRLLEIEAAPISPVVSVDISNEMKPDFVEPYGAIQELIDFHKATSPEEKPYYPTDEEFEKKVKTHVNSKAYKEAFTIEEVPHIKEAQESCGIVYYPNLTTPKMCSLPLGHEGPHN